MASHEAGRNDNVCQYQRFTGLVPARPGLGLKTVRAIRSRGPRLNRPPPEIVPLSARKCHFFGGGRLTANPNPTILCDWPPRCFGRVPTLRRNWIVCQPCSISRRRSVYRSRSDRADETWLTVVSGPRRRAGRSPRGPGAGLWCCSSSRGPSRRGPGRGCRSGKPCRARGPDSAFPAV